MMTIVFAALTMLVLAVCMSIVLGWANQAFHVDVDPRIVKINEELPGANCGGCGYVGCNDYAEAVVAGKAGPDLCPVGGSSCTAAVADIMGVVIEASFPFRPVVHCGAVTEKRLKQTRYQGERTCASANLISGVQGCIYGCMGYGDCVVSCKYDAVHVVNGLAVIDYEKCVGCGACARVCPRNIIQMVPFKAERMLVVACSNKDPGKAVRAVCKVGCIGCKACVKKCDMFDVNDNLSTIDYDKYDPESMDAAQLAIDKCPMKGIVYVGKPREQDLAKVADKEVPSLIEADFKTTVDNTDWQG